MVCPVCGCDIDKYSDCCPNCGTPVLIDIKKNTKKKALKNQLSFEQVPDSSTAPLDKNTIDLSKKQNSEKDLSLENDISSSDETNDRIENEDTKSSFEKFNTDKFSNIPADMYLGNSAKYYYKKRETSISKTRFEKFIEKYHPQKNADPEEFIAAARRTTKISIFLDILSAITFFFGIFSAIGILLSVLSINFADNTKDFYNKDVRTENKSCFILKFLCRALFWLNFFMFLFSAYYQAFIGTGIGMLIGGKLRYIF